MVWKTFVLCYEITAYSSYIFFYSFFQLPDLVVNIINAKCKAFLWGGIAVGRRNLVAWKKVYIPVFEDGLGLKNLTTMNKALLGKNIWHILNDKCSLWVRWVVAMKLNYLSFWRITKKVNSSFSKRIYYLLERIRNVLLFIILGEIFHFLSGMILG